jgi:predicted thioesterase
VTNLRPLIQWRDDALREMKPVKSSLKPGLTKTVRIAVDRGRTIGFMGDEGRVYGTPSMVLDFEYACHGLIAEHLDPGEDTVGAHVSVDHLAPTLEGDTVEFALTVTKVDKRLVEIEGAMRDSLEQCGRGLHRRFVVDVARQYARLAERKAKLAALRKN